MARKSKPLDLSFLKCRGYVFRHNVEKNSLSKVKFGEQELACEIFGRKKNSKDFITEMLKEISHPHIIPVHSMVQSVDCNFLFCQWFSDGNLLSYIKQFGMIQESTANFWFFQLVSAVKYLHDKNFSHCNLSCESVMVSKQNVKLSGLKYIQRCSGDDKIQARRRKSIENYYLPPEVNKGLPCDPKKSDIYSLGIILFIMLNSVVPFTEIDTKQLIEDQMNRNYQLRTSNIRRLSVNCQTMIHILLEPRDEIRWSINKIYGMKWFSKFIDKQGDS